MFAKVSTQRSCYIIKSFFFCSPCVRTKTLFWFLGGQILWSIEGHFYFVTFRHKKKVGLGFGMQNQRKFGCCSLKCNTIWSQVNARQRAQWSFTVPGTLRGVSFVFSAELSKPTETIELLLLFTPKKSSLKMQSQKNFPPSKIQKSSHQESISHFLCANFRQVAQIVLVQLRAKAPPPPKSGKCRSASTSWKPVAAIITTVGKLFNFSAGFYSVWYLHLQPNPVFGRVV